MTTYSEMPAAATVAALLWKLEDQLDEAFATCGELSAALPRARAEAKLPAIAGQAAFQYFSQVALAIGEARGHAVNGHRVLDKVRKVIRMDEGDGLGGNGSDFGDARPKSLFTDGVAEPTPLRRVA